MRRIEYPEHIAEGLDALCKADERLLPVRAMARDVPLRLSRPGFESLVSIVVSQQVSRASATAIFSRLQRLVYPLTPQRLLAAEPATFRQAGLSRPKQQALVAIAEAIDERRLDLDIPWCCDIGETVDRMTRIRGIGPWTAECYLLFSTGHPDIFPARDLALQIAVAHAFSMARQPGEKQLRKLAESWAPWRGVAARLFWAYYRQIRGRDPAPVS